MSAAPTELNPLLSVYTQGSVRAFGTLATLGFAGVSCLKALIRENYYIVQRSIVIVNFDALALFMCLNIGRIGEVIYKYFYAVLGQTQPRDVCPKYE